MVRSSARIGLLLLLIGLFQPFAAGADFQSPAITPEQLHNRRETQSSLLVLDVRDPAEFRVGHVPGAVNLPVSEIMAHLPELDGRNGIVVYCTEGIRTQHAEQVLIEHRIANVSHLDGGLMGWLDSGFPVEKGTGGRLVSSGGN